MSNTCEDFELSQFLAQIANLPMREKVHLGPKKPKVIVISGPTAVGKTKHSLAVAAALGGEIISADSMQVYLGMDIGTAKATSLQRKEIPHHLIDVRNIHERFNVMDFYRESQAAIRGIIARGKVPIVVGGTGFYLHGLIYGPPQGPPSVPEIRQQLEEEMEELGADVLYDRLREIDPGYAKTITGRDRHKIVRALEIVAVTDKRVSDFPKMDNRETLYDFRCWFLYMPKEVLYPLIEMRCDEMIANGFIEEVATLDQQGVRRNSTAAHAIGYRQCLDFLLTNRGPEDFEAFVSAFKRASRRYAKRQYTWFMKEPLFRWLNVRSLPFEKSLSAIVQDYELSF